MLVMGGQTPADRLIQRSAWKGYSLKFGCSILHRASLKTRIDFALGPARVVCHAQHLGVPIRCNEGLAKPPCARTRRRSDGNVAPLVALLGIASANQHAAPWVPGRRVPRKWRSENLTGTIRGRSRLRA